MSSNWRRLGLLICTALSFVACSALSHAAETQGSRIEQTVAQVPTEMLAAVAREWLAGIAYRHPALQGVLENVTSGKYAIWGSERGHFWSVQFGPATNPPSHDGIVVYVDKDTHEVSRVDGWPPENEAERMPAIECKIFRIAERYVATHYPDFDTIKYSPALMNAGDVWSVYYRLPKDCAGGTPNVVIDKKTLKVLQSYHDQ
jgi:hypothetical protein